MTDTTDHEARIADLESELAVAGIEIPERVEDGARALAKARAAEGKSRSEIQQELVELFGAGSGNGTGETPSWKGKSYAEMTRAEKIEYNRHVYGGDDAS